MVTFQTQLNQVNHSIPKSGSAFFFRQIIDSYHSKHSLIKSFFPYQHHQVLFFFLLRSKNLTVVAGSKESCNETDNIKGREISYPVRKPYKCNNCDKFFKNLGNLKHHERVHTGEKPFKCNYCDKCFSQAGNVQRHERTHTGEKPFKCVHCERGFSDASCLQKHARTHTEKMPCKYKK